MAGCCTRGGLGAISSNTNVAGKLESRRWLRRRRSVCDRHERKLDMLELNTQECQNVRSPIHKNAKELKQKRTQVQYHLSPEPNTKHVIRAPKRAKTRRQSTHALPSHLTHTTPALQRQLTAYDQLQIGMNEVSQTKNDYTKHAALTATCSPQGGPLLPFALQLRTPKKPLAA